MRYIDSGDIKRRVPVLWGCANYRYYTRRCSGEVKLFFDSAKFQWKYDCYPSVKCAGFHNKNYQLHQIYKL